MHLVRCHRVVWSVLHVVFSCLESQWCYARSNTRGRCVAGCGECAAWWGVGRGRHGRHHWWTVWWAGDWAEMIEQIELSNTVHLEIQLLSVSSKELIKMCSEVCTIFRFSWQLDPLTLIVKELIFREAFWHLVKWLLLYCHLLNKLPT